MPFKATISIPGTEGLQPVGERFQRDGIGDLEAPFDLTCDRADRLEELFDLSVKAMNFLCATASLTKSRAPGITAQTCSTRAVPENYADADYR